MEFDVGMAISRGVTEPSSSLTQGSHQLIPPGNRIPFTGLIAESMWQMNLRSNEPIDASQAYPERHGEPDCSFYIRTGTCRFGPTCRFNHPPNRKLAIAAARMKGDYPERLGQPECQYYLKTGTCKFGSTCKFHHPKEKAGIAGRVSLNAIGYPLRPGEVECAYYIRTGQCKFGNTCKFHHPQPSNYMVPYRTSPVYSPTPSWPRASFLTSPRWQTPMLLPVYNTYTGQMGNVSSPEQTDQPASGQQRAFSSAGFYAFHRESVFPERPGQPECQFYMKTGDCKFGAVCKFHHPRERFIPAPDCMLSQIGLPLRPGEPMCIFYSRYGICKFGPSCKFDHPMGGFGYDLSGGSLTGEDTVRRFLGPRQLVSGDDDVDTMGENV